MCESLSKTVTWRKPAGEVPDGLLLVEVDLSSGESDIALVYIDDEDGDTLKYHEHGDVWSAWQWRHVNRYLLLDDLLVDR